MKLLLVDDDPLVSSSLKTILEKEETIEVVGIGNNGKQAISLYEQYLPDLLLMDIRMEELNGLEAASVILSSHPDANILFLTTFSDDDYIIKVLKIGAKGYILKQNFASLITSIKAVLSGQTVFGNEIVSKLPSLLHQKNSNDFSSYDINPKESQIIEAIANGLSNKEIADTLFLGEGTVRNYISTILEKLDLRDRTQIAIFYYKNK